MFNLFQNRDAVRDELFNFFKQDDLLRPRRARLLEFMSHKFSAYTVATEKVFDELLAMVNEDPQLLVDATKMFLTDRTTMTKMLDAGRRNKAIKEPTVVDKIIFIADIYECLSMLQIPAYLLSSRRSQYGNLLSQEGILSQFKHFDLSAKDIDQLRLLRNATSHKYTIEDDKIVAKKDGTRISIAVIDYLHEKRNEITSWWMTFALYNLSCMPKYSILTALGVYASINDNSVEWNSYWNGIQQFFGDVIVQQKKEKEEKEKTLSTRIRKVKRRVRRIIRYKVLKPFEDKGEQSYVERNFPMIAERILYHWEYLFAEIEGLATNLTNEMDRDRILKISKTIKKNFPEYKEFLEIIVQNADLHESAIRAKKGSSKEVYEIFFDLVKEKLGKKDKST